MVDLNEAEIKKFNELVDRFGDDPVDLRSDKLDEEEAILVARGLNKVDRPPAAFIVAIERGRVRGDVAPEDDFDDERDKLMYPEEREEE